MVVGGTDTTSNTMEWAMAHMIKNPSIMLNAQEELDRVVGQSQVVEETYISKLHYLQAIVKEVLRLHPALPLLVPHRNSQPCTIGGYSIPEGARIFVNVWAIHPDLSIWPNPLKFDPERFAREADRHWDYSGNDFNYFPFGSKGGELAPELRWAREWCCVIWPCWCTLLFRGCRRGRR